MIVLRSNSPSVLNDLSFENEGLQSSLARRVALLVDQGSQDLASLLFVVFVQRGDTVATIESEIGMAIVADGKPDWDSIDIQDGMFEVVVEIGDEGVSCALYIPDDESVDEKLVELCRQSLRANHAKP